MGGASIPREGSLLRSEAKELLERANMGMGFLHKICAGPKVWVDEISHWICEGYLLGVDGSIFGPTPYLAGSTNKHASGANAD